MNDFEGTRQNDSVTAGEGVSLFINLKKDHRKEGVATV